MAASLVAALVVCVIAFFLGSIPWGVYRHIDS